MDRRGKTDITLLMQQIITGALKVQKLADWLKTLLTTHCAPIQDEWALDMSAKISEGAHYDSASFVVGLEKLSSLCEAMKLDVANHQIRVFTSRSLKTASLCSVTISKLGEGSEN